MAETVTLSLRQLLDLRRAFNSLDAVKSGKDGEIVPLEFDAKTRYRLMKNAAIVERESLVFEKADRKIAEETGVYEGMEQTDANARSLDIYKRKIAEVHNDVVELEGMLFVKLSDLLTRPLLNGDKTDKTRTNIVPQSVLNKLSVIIEEEDEP